MKKCANKECGKEFKQYSSLDKYCSYACRKTKVKKSNYIKPISDKKMEDLKDYRIARSRFMIENPYCEICGNPSTDLHHKMGRVGKNLVDVDNFLSLCRPCHTKVEENPEWAKENGYSKNRL